MTAKRGLAAYIEARGEEVREVLIAKSQAVSEGDGPKVPVVRVVREIYPLRSIYP
jgi:hypothetical protein